MACTIKTYSVEIKADDWKTDENGKKYFVNPVTGKRRYADAPNHRVTFTPLKTP